MRFKVHNYLTQHVRLARIDKRADLARQNFCSENK